MLIERVLMLENARKRLMDDPKFLREVIEVSRVLMVVGGERLELRLD